MDCIDGWAGQPQGLPLQGNPPSLWGRRFTPDAGRKAGRGYSILPFLMREMPFDRLRMGLGESMANSGFVQKPGNAPNLTLLRRNRKLSRDPVLAGHPLRQEIQISVSKCLIFSHLPFQARWTSDRESRRLLAGTGGHPHPRPPPAEKEICRASPEKALRFCGASRSQVTIAKTAERTAPRRPVPQGLC